MQPQSPNRRRSSDPRPMPGARRPYLRRSAQKSSAGPGPARCRALSADASSTHGLSPQFVIHYELGRIRGSRSSPFEALQSNTTALQDPLSIVISTHAVSDSDLLSVPIDDALS